MAPTRLPFNQDDPVLYILHTNDFPRYLEKFCVMFADDIVLIVTNKNNKQLKVDTLIALKTAKKYYCKWKYCKSFQIIFTANPQKQH